MTGVVQDKVGHALEVRDAVARAARLTGEAGETVKKALRNLELARRDLTGIAGKLDTSTDTGIADYNLLAEVLFGVNMLSTELRGVLG